MITLRSEKAPRSHELALSDFPARIGRGPDCAIVLQEKGVWDTHCVLNLNDGFIEAVPEEKAHSYCNGELIAQATRLRNGDALTFGSITYIVETSPPIRKSLALREAVLWGILVATTFLEIALLLGFH